MSEMHMDRLDQLIENTDNAITSLAVGSTEWERAVDVAMRLRATRSDLVEKEPVSYTHLTLPTIA